MLKQIRSSKKMAALQGKIRKINERYKEDPLKMHKAVSKLFNDNGVHPFSSIGIVLLQIPVFIALYKIVREGDIFSGAPLGLWINNLGVPDPYYILPVVAGIMMLMGTRLACGTGSMISNGLAYMLSIFCTVFLLNQPAGLALYFLTGSIIQLGMNAIYKLSYMTIPIRKN
jgi:YidC/Oxa1 family membrane protein insertase